MSKCGFSDTISFQNRKKIAFEKIAFETLTITSFKCSICIHMYFFFTHIQKYMYMYVAMLLQKVSYKASANIKMKA